MIVVDLIIAYYLLMFSITLLGQLCGLILSILIGRELRRSPFAWTFLIAFSLGIFSGMRSLPLLSGPEIVALMHLYSTPDLLASALIRPAANWLMVVGLIILYRDLTRR